MDRRTLLQLLASSTVIPVSALGQTAETDPVMKAIPSSGELTPIIGMGTFRVFEVASDAALRDQRTQVMKTFLDMGGTMIDCSPMYGPAEELVGYGLEKLGRPTEVMSSTKVWNATAAEGRAQFERSLQLWGVDTIDIYMLHNVVEDWEEHLAVLNEYKSDGRIRYLGLTTSHGREHSRLEHIMETQALDFVQLTYNIVDRAVEQRLLPLAAEKNIGIMANRPFQGGPLLERVRNQPLPGWAAELDCANWAQVFLKFVVSHPAVTCAIPGTSQVAHMVENMGASRGALPDAAMRERMSRDFESLT